MKAPKYVSESPELIQAREWEENTRWQTLQEIKAAIGDSRKDLLGFTGKRFGVPESYSHAYDAPREVAA